MIPGMTTRRDLVAVAGQLLLATTGQILLASDTGLLVLKELPQQFDVNRGARRDSARRVLTTTPTSQCPPDQSPSNFRLRLGTPGPAGSHVPNGTNRIVTEVPGPFWKWGPASPSPQSVP